MTAPGQFVDGSYSNMAGTRTYKVYIPNNGSGKPVPLLVMLHGCTQSPDDFAAGTCMNRLADLHGFLVVYPAQAAAANGMKCWNWYDENEQVRDQGEPSLIAGITRKVASEYAIDKQRIFIAGLSAGAAMAVILGVTYPDVFAAVGVHSGLPYGAAHSMASTLAAMRGGNSSAPAASSRGGRKVPLIAATKSIPTIVFHGDNDATVSANNGAHVVDQAVALATVLHGPLKKTVEERRSANGREFTATIYRGSKTRTVVEHWVVHGVGHAWSGGSSAGSFADESGPDASAEMVRFFLAQKRRPVLLRLFTRVLSNFGSMKGSTNEG
jgi:poly(hydroxyalkanoate) depolymerase family esterase